MYSPAIGYAYECEGCGEREEATKKQKQIKKLRQILK